MTYFAPDPTPEQIENGIARHYDPDDRGGLMPYYGLAPDDTLAAACVIHDELYLEGGPRDLGAQVDRNFERDCLLLALSVDCPLGKAFELGKAELFSGVVYLVGPKLWRKDSRNTEVTRAQGLKFVNEAKRHINACAIAQGKPLPYPEVKLSLA